MQREQGSLMDTSPSGELIELLYEAALDADKWTVVVRELGDLLEDSPILFGLAYPTGRGLKPIIQTSHLLDEKIVYSFSGNAHTIEDLKLAQTFMTAPIAKSHSLDEYFSEAEIRQSFEFRHYFEPYDLAPYGLAMVLSRTIDHLGTLSVFRRSTDARHSARSRALLDALGPHLHLAVRISHELGHLRNVNATLQDILDRQAAAIFLIQTSGKILYTNRSADALLNESDLLNTHSGVLSFRDTELQRKLGYALWEAVGDTPKKATMFPAQLQSATTRKHTCSVAPIREDIQLPTNMQHAALVAFSGKLSEDIASAQLQMAFGLTPRQAEVVELVVLRGLSVREAGQWLTPTISETTVKTHLKRAFERLGVNSQAELMVMLMSSPLATLVTD